MDAELKAYLDIAKRSIRPTLEEEMELAKTIRAGRRALKFLADRDRAFELGLISSQEHEATTAKLKSKIRAAEEAKRQLIEKHLYLTINLPEVGCKKLPSAEQIQEAALILVNAADQWSCNPIDGRFGSYAYICIEKGTKGIMEKRSILSLPKGTGPQIGKVCSLDRAIQDVCGGSLPARQRLIALEMNIPVNEVKKIFCMKEAVDAKSLDAPVLPEDGDEGSTLGDFVPADPTNSTPEKLVTASVVRDTVAAVLASLEETEERVIRYRFGFVNGDPYEPEEVAHVCGMTLQEEQLIEVRAMRHLRHPIRSQRLVGLL